MRNAKLLLLLLPAGILLYGIAWWAEHESKWREARRKVVRLE